MLFHSSFSIQTELYLLLETLPCFPFPFKIESELLKEDYKAFHNPVTTELSSFLPTLSDGLLHMLFSLLETPRSQDHSPLLHWGNATSFLRLILGVMVATLWGTHPPGEEGEHIWLRV